MLYSMLHTTCRRQHFLSLMSLIKELILQEQHDFSAFETSALKQETGPCLLSL